MKRLTLLAPINAFTGYGLHSFQIVRDLTRMLDLYVAIRPVSQSEAFGAKIPTDIRQRFVSGPQPEEWELLLHPPSFVPTPGKKTAYFTMLESTKPPPMGVHLLNRAEVVIVPCWWNASCLSACGVKKPIRVVPLGILTNIFKYAEMPTDFPRVIRFGAAGRMANGGVRKGLNEVIDAFSRAFPDESNVRLEVKAWADCPIKKCDDPRVLIHQAYWSDEQLADWFKSLTCFVSAAKGEGFGLMQLQALAIGRPLISVRFGGVAEFFESGMGWPLDFKLGPARQAYEGCGHWAEPTEESLIECMRQCARTDPTELTYMGIVASQKVAHLSWESSNLVLACVLEEFGAI